MTRASARLRLKRMCFKTSPPCFFGRLISRNDQGGTGQVGLGVGSIEKPYRLLAILGDIESDGKPGRPYRLLDQKDVRFIMYRR
jgi:hypothetical protein